MIRYYRRSEFGETEEINFETFLKGLHSEFMWSQERWFLYHPMRLVLLGQKIVGSVHMYWCEGCINDNHETKTEDSDEHTNTSK
jgi:hypothetical protein